MVNEWLQMGKPWESLNNEKRPKGNFLGMRIYVALTSLHALGPPHTLPELTPKLISSSSI